MRFLARLMAVASFGFITATFAVAAPTEPVEGAEYHRLQNAPALDDTQDERQPSHPFVLLLARVLAAFLEFFLPLRICLGQQRILA